MIGELLSTNSLCFRSLVGNRQQKRVMKMLRYMPMSQLLCISVSQRLCFLQDAPSEEGADAEEALPLEAPAVGEAPAVEIDREAIAVLMPQKEMLDAEIEALKELLPEEQEEEAAEAEDGQEPLAIGGPSTKEDPVPLAIAN